MIVQLNGGLGNQLFQYAFGRARSVEYKAPLYFHKMDLDCGRRHYALTPFNVNVQFKAPVGVLRFEEVQFNYDPRVHAASPSAYYVGYWQTERYFDLVSPILRKELTLKYPVSDQTAALSGKILRSPESTFIHVRRGDYLNPDTAAYHGNMGMDYYKSAMRIIADRCAGAEEFFIFSDDPDWCRRSFPGCQVVDHNIGKGRESEDLYLMSLCKNAIFPNSSFGWWGAWLGDTRPGRICIGPKQWFAGAKLNTEDIIPERWIRL